MNLQGRDIVAIDWDHRQVRGIRCRMRRSRLEVRQVFHESVPASVTTEDASSFGQWLSRVMVRNGCGGLAALMAVPRDQVVLKTLSLPPTPDEELPAAVQFQMQKELTFPPEQAVIDFIVGKHLSPDSLDRPAGPLAQTEVLVAATRTEVIDYYRTVAAQAHLKLRRIGLRCFCNLQTVRACTSAEPDSRLLIVNVGPELTEIDIIRGWSLLFSRSASVGLDESSPGDDFYHRLSLEVVRSVQAARAATAGLELDGVVIAAPQHVADRIAARIGERLGVRAWTLEPGRSISLPAGRQEGAGELSAALGLGLGEMSGARRPFDFLHPRKPVDLALNRRRKRVTVAAAAAVFLAAALVVNQLLLLAARQKLDRVELPKVDAKTLNRISDVNRQAERADDRPAMLDEFRRINNLLTGNEKWHRQSHVGRIRATVGPEGGWRCELDVVAARKEMDSEIESALRAEYAEQEGVTVRCGPPLPVASSPEWTFKVMIDYSPPGSRK